MRAWTAAVLGVAVLAAAGCGKREQASSSPDPVLSAPEPATFGKEEPALPDGAEAQARAAPAPPEGVAPPGSAEGAEGGKAPEDASGIGFTADPLAVVKQAEARSAQVDSQAGAPLDAPPAENGAAAAASSYNELVLAAIKKMPSEGGYSVKADAALAFKAAVKVEGASLAVNPARAMPSFCSSATYLVFLSVIQELLKGPLKLESEVLGLLPPRGQEDGQGVWGRWNANGPGTAVLFQELALGRNFTSFSEAKPGDFMKIFWTEKVGKGEHGHSVVFLGLSKGASGEPLVEFWSSNQEPGGYARKTVPRAKIKQAIFSRLENPQNLSGAGKMPPLNEYLKGLVDKPSTFPVAAEKSGIAKR